MTALTLSSTDDLSDPANAVNTVTTPMPIINADAVAAVRRGERMALRRARTPGMRRNRAIGAPITDPAGRAATGPTATTPAAVSSAPRPARPSAPLDAPVTTATTPPASINEPATRRHRDDAERSTATSRSAASGATREARTAGASDASSVIRIPTSGAMTSVVVLIVRPPAGSANPNASNSAFKPWASAKPRPRPTAEATTPTTIDSPASDQNTWRRSAPIARSSADDRWRWAAMIENVLLMLNVATSSATAANTSQEDAQEADEVGVDLVVRLVDEIVTADHLDAVRHATSAIAGDDRVLAHPVVGLDEQRRHATRLTRHVLLGAGQRERGERRRSEPVFAAERRDPDDLDVDRFGRGDDRVVTDRQVAVVGGAPVDDDLVVRHRCPTLDELVRVEVGIVDPVAGERRRAFATELLAVGAGELTEALDLRRHDGDAVDRRRARSPVEPSIRSWANSPSVVSVLALRTTASDEPSADWNNESKLARSVSPSSIVPASRATPRHTASDVLSNRRMWARTEEMTRRNMVQDPIVLRASRTRSGVGCSIEPTVAPVGEEHDRRRRSRRPPGRA